MSKSKAAQTPVEPYRVILDDSGSNGYVNRILIGVAVTGLLRTQWVQARYGQIIPVNWSQVEMWNYMDGYMPQRYQVADAQNMIVKTFIEKEFEWLLLYEHDVCPPANAFVKINEYITECKIPVVSGLYFTRSEPSEPLVFRGRGTGAFRDWEFGDKVWVDGTPTGFLLIHRAILEVMWNESPEYQVRPGVITRRIFDTPRSQWFDPQENMLSGTTGTSDLQWCTRVIKDSIFEKSGWTEYQKMEYPFLIDTSLFCGHIDNMSGIMYPQGYINGHLIP